MKKLYSLFFLIVLSFGLCFGQDSTLYFPLSTNFLDSTGATSLTLLPNLAGDNGQFQPKLIPTATCPAGGIIQGWAFEKMVGFEFQNNGFIGNEWTVSYLYFVDQYNIPTAPYVRQFVLDDAQEIGFFIDPVQLQMESYHWGSFFGFPVYQSTVLSPVSSINIQTIYHFTFTRSAAGVVRFYLNGALAGSMNDAITSFIPSVTDDRLVFFQDNATGTYPNEAESGWVSDLIIANHVWSDSLIQARASICEVVLFPVDQSKNSFPERTPKDAANVPIISPNPATTFIRLNADYTLGPLTVNILDQFGRNCYEGIIHHDDEIDLPDHLATGHYWVRIVAPNGETWTETLFIQ